LAVLIFKRLPLATAGALLVDMRPIVTRAALALCPSMQNGRIEQTNFDTYNSMRIAEMPKVESIIMPSGGTSAWGGVGEPTICVAAPAVLNAYFKATGQRIRSFPLKNHNIQMA
jgi:CO/xanthine dehydrogenase Mo-binding subunit